MNLLGFWIRKIRNMWLPFTFLPSSRYKFFIRTIAEEPVNVFKIYKRKMAAYLTDIDMWLTWGWSFKSNHESAMSRDCILCYFVYWCWSLVKPLGKIHSGQDRLSLSNSEVPFSRSLSTRIFRSGCHQETMERPTFTKSWKHYIHRGHYRLCVDIPLQTYIYIYIHGISFKYVS